MGQIREMTFRNRIISTISTIVKAHHLQSKLEKSRVHTRKCVKRYCAILTQKVDHIDAGCTFYLNKFLFLFWSNENSISPASTTRN